MALWESPHISLVPKELNANLAFRREMVKLGASSEKAAEELRVMCGRDILFYVNTFCWIYEPRVPEVRPFITWDFQDEVIRTIQECTGVCDLGIGKSRDMGATWLCIVSDEHDWHFKQYCSFLEVSRKQELVDSSTDSKSLFWKIQFIIDNLPKWLKPAGGRYEHTFMKYYNPETRSVINGESTTGDVGRGDRRTRILLDEFAAVPEGHKVIASTVAATNTRIFNSTFERGGVVFREVMRSPSLKKLYLHWTKHPEKSKGLYYEKNGKPSSPWRDAEKPRCVTAAVLAAEVDMDENVADCQFFESEILDRQKRECTRPPFAVGDICYSEEHPEQVAWAASPGGPFNLWIKLDGYNRPPKANYGIGVDISAGTGASNSCLVVGDLDTRELVLEYVNPNILPENFAKLAVAVCKWFCSEDKQPAFLIWEGNGGVGRTFGKTVVETCGFRNVYYRRDEMRLSTKISDKPGWYSVPDTRMAKLGAFRLALATMSYQCRSAETLNECLSYVYDDDGTVIHTKQRDADDPSGARSNHGDRVIANALLEGIMSDHKKKVVSQAPVVDASSIMGRRLRAQEAEREKEPAFNY